MYFVFETLGFFSNLREHQLLKENLEMSAHVDSSIIRTDAVGKYQCGKWKEAV